MSLQIRRPRRRLLSLGVAAAACLLPFAVLPGASASGGPAPAAGRETLRSSTVQLSVNNSFPMRPWKQREDVARAMSLGDVVGWQEIAKPEQQEAIRAQEGWATYWPDGFSEGVPRVTSKNQNPISYRSDKWQRVEAGSLFTSNPIKDVSGDRWLSYVILKDRATGFRLARWNIHFVPGAWNNRGTAAQKRNRAELKRAWLGQQQITASLISDLATRSQAVVGGGDVNRIKYPFLDDRVVYDVLPMSLDHLTHVADPRIRPVGMVRNRMHSDHPAVQVTYDLKRWRPRR